MHIGVFSLKGGVGKTIISCAIAKETGAGIITNDPNTYLEGGFSEDSVIKVLPNEPLPEGPSSYELVYDLAGVADNRLTSLLPKLDLLIVPMIYKQKNDWKLTHDSLVEVKQYCKNILLIINDTDPKYHEEIKDAMAEHHPTVPIFVLKGSTAYHKVLDEGVGLSEIVAKGGLLAYAYKDAFAQLTELLKLIAKLGENK